MKTRALAAAAIAAMRSFFMGNPRVPGGADRARANEREMLALVEEKERAQSILSASGVGTWEWNVQTDESRADAQWSAMLGFSEQEVLPTPNAFWATRVHPDDLVRSRNAMQLCLDGATPAFSCDVRARRKDGSWMWILSRARVVSRDTQGRVNWIGGITTDITEFKQAESNLRDMQSFLDRAGRVAGVGAWELNLQSREMRWSEQTCNIYAVASDFRPDEQTFLEHYEIAARDAIRTAMRDAVELGRSWDLTLPFVTAQGAAIWVRCMGEVEFDDSGAVRLVGTLQDVTLEKQRQLEVQRSGQILRGAIDAINEAFVLYDPQDRLVFCNEKYRLLYDKSVDLIVPGASFESIIRGGAERGQYPQATGRVEAWVQERLAAHRSGDITLEQQLGNGRWLRIVERRMPDGHHVGFRVDITELKLATQAAQAANTTLLEQRRRLQEILEGTNVGTWEWNVQSGASQFSERWAQIIGYSVAELEPVDSSTWTRLTHPDDLARCQKLLDAHFSHSSEYYECEFRMAHKSGHWVWVLSRGRVATWTPQGLPLMMSGTHMDISDRKAAADALAKTSATLQAVLDSAVDVGIIATDCNRMVTVFNRGAEHLLGYSAHEVVGKRTSSMFFDLAQLSLVRESLELLLGRPPSTDEVFAQVSTTNGVQEWNFVRKDGSKFAASLMVAPMYGPAGELSGYLGIAYDISRQKEYEASLKRAMHAAEQSSIAKSQFLANMSHEIRTPMNAILGMLKLLHHTTLSERQRDYTLKTEGAARSLLGLLNDILDFSKVEAGKMQLDPEPFELDQLLGDLSVILSSNLGSKSIDILYDIDPAIAHSLVGDALRIKQVLINLGGNAVKFTARGQVLIRWKLLQQLPGRLRLGISVSDTGIGIAAENQARIFEAFTQAEANTTRRYGGSGLGLVISQRLLGLMGGNLELSSVPGEGSTFSFILELPIAPGAAAAAVATPNLRPRVLLIDDNAAARASAASMLGAIGWEVELADSGEQGLQRLQERLRHPERAALDAVFADWQMPGLDGWETLRGVRALYGSAAPPALVLISSQSRELLESRSLHDQKLIDGFLVKPLTTSMYRSALSPGRVSGTAVSALDGQGRLQRLSGMRILVVEDNLINQQVAQELLLHEGATIALAENGRVGVDMVAAANEAFDVVLMDLQMPVMDGLTAVRAIRMGLGLSNLPVIAMTANAMATDREACLQAGMNDHVGKPFDLDELVAVLIRWTRWPAKEVTSAFVRDGALDGDLAQTTFAWPPGVDGQAALQRMGGNCGLLVRTLRSYINDASNLVDRLSGLLAAQDAAAIVRELHSFKGLSATLGVRGLAGDAAAAEAMAREAGLAGGMADTLQHLGQEVGRVLPVLRELAVRLEGLVQTEGGESGKPAAWGASRPTPPVQPLRELLALLLNGDMAALELHADLRQNAQLELAGSASDLDGAMAELDFGRAAVACRNLIEQLEQ